MMSTKNKWLAVSVLAIVLPISLLTTFKLTGIISEPIQPETITQESVRCDMERPSCIMGIDKKIEKSFVDEGVSAILGVLVCSYLEDSAAFLYGDCILLRVYFNATVTHGSLISITYHVQPVETNSSVGLFIFEAKPEEEHNIDIINKKGYGAKGEEAFANARVAGSPCYWEFCMDWVFKDANTLNHGLNVTNEFLYRTKTGYKNIVTSFILRVVVDAGNDFDSPNIRPIGFGSYFASINLMNDPVDFYKVELEEGDSVVIDLAPSSFRDPDLYLYDSNAMLVASSCSRGFVSEQLEFTASKSGFWFIKVARYRGSSGTYTLSISQKS